MREHEQYLKMTDRSPEITAGVIQVEPEAFEAFVKSGFQDVANEMMRWSVAPPRDIDTVMLVENTPEALSSVQIEDPNLQFSRGELENPTTEILSLVTPVALAKSAIVEAEYSLSEPQIDALAEFKNKILEGVGTAIAKVGGKRSVQAVSVLSLIATACTSVVPPTQPLIPSPTQVVVETEAPTAVPAETRIAPTQEQMGEFLSYEVLSQEQVLADPKAQILTNDLINGAEGLKSKPENALFDEYAPWGIFVTTPRGPGLFLFIKGKDNDSNIESTWMVVPTDDGRAFARLLEPGELTSESGDKRTVLLLTKDRNTGRELANPLVILSLNASRELLVKFNTDPNVLSDREFVFTPFGEDLEVSNQQAKIPALKLASFVAPTVVPPEQDQEMPGDQEKYEGSIEVWLNPEYSMKGNISLSANSGETFLDEICTGVSSGQFRSFFNGDKNLCKQYLVEHNGRFPELVKLPVKDKTTPRVGAVEDADWISYESFDIDLKKPVEFRFYGLGNNPENPDDFVDSKPRTEVLGGFSISVDSGDGHLVVSIYDSIASNYSWPVNGTGYNWQSWAVFERLLARPNFEEPLLAWRNASRGASPSFWSMGQRRRVFEPAGAE